ncbi:MAG: hypothetical protein ACMG6S_28970 [Byssovorax sp.]
MRRRHLLTFALAAASALLGASCLSPTLPLPPPDVESIQQAGPTQWTIAGSCLPGAVVSIFNDTRNQGVLVEDTAQLGKFVVILDADKCDVGWVSQVFGTEASAQVPFVVEAQSVNDTGAASDCH